MKTARTTGEVAIRDEEGRKLCIYGQHWEPEKDFAPHSTTSDGLHSWCRRCLASAQYHRKYGIDLTAIEALLVQQGGCAICKRTEPKRGRRWSVDHDHSCCPGDYTCGKCVRGILCESCNIGLGSFSDDPIALESAAAYLRSGFIR